MQARRTQDGFTLLELVCVTAIILILASLLLSAVGRAYGRAIRMKREFEAPALIERFRDRLTAFCQTQDRYPLLTARQLYELGVFDSAIIDFLGWKGVAFHPFASTNLDEAVVLEIGGHSILRKGDLKPRAE